MGWFNHQLADIDSDLFRIGFHPPQRSSGFSNKLLPVRRARGVKRIGSTSIMLSLVEVWRFPLSGPWLLERSFGKSLR